MIRFHTYNAVLKKESLHKCRILIYLFTNYLWLNIYKKNRKQRIYIIAQMRNFLIVIFSGNIESCIPLPDNKLKLNIDFVEPTHFFVLSPISIGLERAPKTAKIMAGKKVIKQKIIKIILSDLIKLNPPIRNIKKHKINPITKPIKNPRKNPAKLNVLSKKFFIVNYIKLVEKMLAGCLVRYRNNF
jgi:hypothetical protein